MAQITLEQAMQMAAAHQRAGRLRDAEASCRRILALSPQFAPAWHLLGVIAGQAGQFQAAADLIRRAVELAPAIAQYICDLGLFLHQLGQTDQAIACFQRALTLDPNLPEAHSNLGIACQTVGRLDDARACFQRAVALRPGDAQAHYNLANVLQDKQELPAAEACYRRAIALHPGHAQSHNNLGIICLQSGRFDEAIACFETALLHNPDYVDAHHNRGNAFKEMGRIDEALACYRRVLALAPMHRPSHDNLVYTTGFHPAATPPEILSEARKWNLRHAHRPGPSPIPRDNDPDRPLRVGYVSSNFHRHPVGRFMRSLIAAHDPQNIRAVCYAQAPKGDDLTADIQARASQWRDITALSDQHVAQTIAEDRIDILVDLTMHMADNRLLVFARRPAPVQVTFAAYPGTTGMDAIDYRLTDPHLDPPGEHDQHYSEKSIRLPDTFWCDGLLADDPPVNSPPAMANGHITFGCLNNFCKVHDAVLDLWAATLAAVPDSRFLLLAPPDSPRQRVVDRMGQAGIDPRRLEFVPHLPAAAYMQTYHRIDIGLDTFPYNGHATTFDALWMGVPVITLVGNTVVGRGGLSLLTNIGLPELVAHAPGAFVAIAAELAADQSRLGGLRPGLRQRMRQSPLMDAARFARGVEAAYRAMWHTRCAHPSP